MASESKTFISVFSGQETKSESRLTGDLLEIALVYGLILIAIWTPQGRLNSIISLAAAVLTLLFAFRKHSVRELGLGRPFAGILPIVAMGAMFVALIAAAGVALRSFGPPQPLPWNRAWQYGIWALLQEFIIQSFLFVHLEKYLGSRRTVFYAAALFAAAHIPSPLLTSLSFFGALFFCEMFRRYRNIFPIGLVHAVLGLTIAASLPDHWLHHMRVGLGFLNYHP